MADAIPDTLPLTQATRAPRPGLWFHQRDWMQGLITLPYLWLVALFLVPSLIITAMSVATQTPTAPPFGWGDENPLVNGGTTGGS